ncbi:MAG: hypothetical protein ACXW3P_08375, partial [Rhodospirillales bacterium]
MKYTVGCELGYQVSGPSTLILNVEAARTERQTILDEQLTIEPRCATETYLMPESGNRYLKLRPQNGLLSIRYRAEVE